MRPTTILTCAVSGNAPVSCKYPYEYPVTPAQICAAVVEAAGAGASVAHIHVRDPKTGHGSRDPALFREVVDRIRSSGVDIIINLTAGMGAVLLPDPVDESRALPQSDVIGVDDRTAHLKECLPDIASLDVTTGNQQEGSFEFVYLNTTRTLRGMARRFQQLGVKPELEVFQAGDVLFANQLASEGLIEKPAMYQFVLGVRWGAPADPATVMYMKGLLPPGAIWGALGIGCLQMPIVAQSFLLGGNVRVGLEDNLYLSRGVFATNGRLVERARSIVEYLGGCIATPEEARKLLGLEKYR